MIKKINKKELTRNEVFLKYLSLQNAEEEMLPSIQRDIDKTLPLFEGKTEMEIFIGGTIRYDKNRDYEKLFTFLNKTYNIADGNCHPTKWNKDEFERALTDLDKFDGYMKGEPIQWYSEIEGEYVNYSRVQNAYVNIELR